MDVSSNFFVEDLQSSSVLMIQIQELGFVSPTLYPVIQTQPPGCHGGAGHFVPAAP